MEQVYRYKIDPLRIAAGRMMRKGTYSSPRFSSKYVMPRATNRVKTSAKGTASQTPLSSSSLVQHNVADPSGQSGHQAVKDLAGENQRHLGVKYGRKISSAEEQN